MKKSEWYVEFHECGWSSRWMIVRDVFSTRSKEYLNTGYSSKERAESHMTELKVNAK